MEVQRSSSQVGEAGGFYYGRTASGTVSVIGRSCTAESTRRSAPSRPGLQRSPRRSTTGGSRHLNKRQPLSGTCSNTGRMGPAAAARAEQLRLAP